jgi:hypothetical protein
MEAVFRQSASTSEGSFTYNIGYIYYRFPVFLRPYTECNINLLNSSGNYMYRLL